MSLDEGEAFWGGASRAVSRNGLILMVAAFFVNIVYTVGSESTLPGEGAIYFPEQLAVGTNTGAVILVISYLLTAVLYITGYRVFVTDETEAIPREAYTRRMPQAVINFLLGITFYIILTAVGLLLFIIPGIYAFVSLIFVDVHVAVDDSNFLEALLDSAKLTKGNRWGIVVILISLFVVAIFCGVCILLASAIAGEMAGFVVQMCTVSFFNVLFMGILARAFSQLKDVSDVGTETNLEAEVIDTTPRPGFEQKYG